MSGHACAQTSCRRGSSKETRGTAYVVYEDIYDAKEAADHLSGFNVANRYLIVLFFGALPSASHTNLLRSPAVLRLTTLTLLAAAPKRAAAKLDAKEKEKELRELQQRHGIVPQS
jgi:hypothetical protein